MRRGRTWPRLELDLVLDADAHNKITQSLREYTRSPLWTLKYPNADHHCAVFVDQKLQVMGA